MERVVPVARSRAYDVTLLQRELVSTLSTMERFTGRPRVLDVDDAVWLTSVRAERSFRSLVKMCDGVVCGNQFIADHVSQWNQNWILLPTAVDTERFRPGDAKPAAKLIIGWSGLHAGSKYLLGIERALFELLKTRKDAVLRVVSDSRPDFRFLQDSMVEFIRWSPDNEVRTIQEMSVGLMPIDDTLWSRGKCSYKMLLYMACGVPVVVSPFGMNKDVLAQSDVGFGAVSDEDWMTSIGRLLDDATQARSTGMRGREIVERHYSLAALSTRLGEYLLSVRDRSSKD
jgi:glycosyltransferase involved in cell wall biosynthesis